MTQEHKGKRTQVLMSIPAPVLDLVGQDQERYGVPELSQFAADLLCHIYGMPDLARKLGRDAAGQLELPIATVRAAPGDPIVNILCAAGSPSAVASGPGSTEAIKIKIRVPNRVQTRIKKDTARFGVSSATRFIVDLFCNLYGRPDLARELNHRKEQLKLSVLGRGKPAPELDPDLVA